MKGNKEKTNNKESKNRKAIEKKVEEQETNQDTSTIPTLNNGEFRVAKPIAHGRIFMRGISVLVTHYIPIARNMTLI